MELGLSEKAIVVTGAAAGIGEATARLLLAEGALVVAVDCAEGSMAALGERLTPVLPDLADINTAEKVVQTAMALHGRVDGLVNNAGAVTLRSGFLATSDADWDETFALNIHAVRRMTRAALPAMIAAGGGSLVHLTSEAARLPDGHEADYATCKIALLGLSKALAIEFGPRGVRSNVVAPGPTRTAMWETSGGFGETIASFLGPFRYSRANRESVMKFLFEDESFSFETLRAAGFAAYGGADLGEVLVTAAAITGGDEASWHRAWKATAAGPAHRRADPGC